MHSKTDRDYADVRKPAKKPGTKKTPVPSVMTDAQMQKTIQNDRGGYKRLDPIKVNDRDRMVEAIEWLAINLPGHLVPLNLLHWMVHPDGDSKRLKPQKKDGVTTADFRKFAGDLGRIKGKMMEDKRKLFFIKDGKIRCYTSAEEIASIGLPKMFKRFEKSVNQLDRVKSLIGDTRDLDKKQMGEYAPGYIQRYFDIIESGKKQVEALPVRTG